MNAACSKTAEECPMSEPKDEQHDRPDNADSKDENGLVQSEKCQLNICKDSLFCRIDSRTSKHNGKKLISHYVTKEDMCTDITGETGLKLRDELIRVNGKRLKNKEQIIVRRIFEHIKQPESTIVLNIKLNIRRWIPSIGPMNERKWVKMEDITISVVLVPYPELQGNTYDDLTGGETIGLEPNSTPKPCKRKGKVRARSFQVIESNLTIDKEVDLSSGCIDIDKTSAVKRCKIKCEDGYVSDVPLPDNSVGLSVITKEKTCAFYCEKFSGFNKTPKPVFNDYIYCMRIRLNDPNGFLFLSSVIGGDIKQNGSRNFEHDGSRDVKFVHGKDDFGSIRCEQNIDERCFIGYHLGSDVFLASLIYREWFIAYDKEKDRLYMKLIPIDVQRTYARGNKAQGYNEADRMFENCAFEFFFDIRGVIQRFKQSFKPYLCGVTH